MGTSWDHLGSRGSSGIIWKPLDASLKSSEIIWDHLLSSGNLSGSPWINEIIWVIWNHSDSSPKSSEIIWDHLGSSGNTSGSHGNVGSSGIIWNHLGSSGESLKKSLGGFLEVSGMALEGLWGDLVSSGVIWALRAIIAIPLG